MFNIFKRVYINNDNNNKVHEINGEFYKSVEKFLKLFKYIGVLPLKLTTRKSGYLIYDYKSIQFYYSYFIICILYLIYVKARISYLIKKFQNLTTTATETIDTVELILSIALKVLIHMLLIKPYMFMNEIFQKIEKFDTNLRDKFFKKQIIFPDIKRYNYIIDIFNWGLLFLWLIFGSYQLFTADNYIGILRPLTLFYIYLFPFHLNFFFIIYIIIAIKYRSKLLKNKIDEFVIDIKQGSFPDSYPHKHIGKIRILHNELYDCTSTMNDAYGKFHYYFYLTNVYYQSFLIYEITDAIINGAFQKEMISISKSVWSFYLISIYIIFIIISSNFNNEVSGGCIQFLINCIG